MARSKNDNSARATLVELLERSADGDRLAFEQLYNLTCAKLFGVCFRILNDKNGAEDVLQESYVKIWRNAGRFDPARASPITWLAAIARNSAIDRKRAIGNRQMVSDEVLAELPSEEIDQQGRLEQLEEGVLLEKCLDTLERDHRDVIRTAFFEGHSYRELAERLDRPLGTIKSWVRRGLQKLKDCVDDG